MYSLVIDTANEYCSFALLKEVNGQKTLVATSQTKTHNNLIDLAAEILDKFLKVNDVSYRDLKKIYVNVGPGSFTGEKAGLNIAKTIWSVNQSIQMYTANTIEILTRMNGIGILDAKGNKSYFGVYKNFECEEPIRLVDNSEISSLCQNFDHLEVYDYAKTDPKTFLNHMLSILDAFQLAERPQNVEPLYIKEPL